MEQGGFPGKIRVIFGSSAGSFRLTEMTIEKISEIPIELIENGVKFFISGKANIFEIVPRRKEICSRM